jgi:hypothetical protein
MNISLSLVDNNLISLLIIIQLSLISLISVVPSAPSKMSHRVYNYGYK